MAKFQRYPYNIWQLQGRLSPRYEKHRASIRAAIRRRRVVGLKQGRIPAGEDEHGRLTEEGKEALLRYNVLSINELAQAMGWSYGATWRFVQRHGGTWKTSVRERAGQRALELQRAAHRIRAIAQVMHHEYGWSYSKTWRFLHGHPVANHSTGSGETRESRS